MAVIFFYVSPAGILVCIIGGYYSRRLAPCYKASAKLLGRFCWWGSAMRRMERRGSITHWNPSGPVLRSFNAIVLISYQTVSDGTYCS